MTAPGSKPPTRRAWSGLPVSAAVAAGLIAAGYGLCHALGLREDVSLLFATSHAGPAGGGRILVAGIYVLAYLGAVLVAPILLIAAALCLGGRLLWRRLFGRPSPRLPGGAMDARGPVG